MTMANEREMRVKWLQALSIGDEVVIRRSRSMQLGTVQRFTPTQLIAVCRSGREYRYRKRDGMEVGASYGYSIEPATVEVRKAIATAERRYRFDCMATNSRRPTDDEVEVMLAALDEFRAKQMSPL